MGGLRGAGGQGRGQMRSGGSRGDGHRTGASPWVVCALHRPPPAPLTYLPKPATPNLLQVAEVLAAKAQGGGHVWWGAKGRGT